MLSSVICFNQRYYVTKCLPAMEIQLISHDIVLRVRYMVDEGVCDYSIKGLSHVVHLQNGGEMYTSNKLNIFYFKLGPVDRLSIVTQSVIASDIIWVA